MSNLLSQASLVMIPSGYKEDVVYSQIPTNGNGDLSFTRASNGTRVNSAGLVEICPWNLCTYSEEFDTASWFKSSTTVTANAGVAPNGTTTADKIVPTTTGTNRWVEQSRAIIISSFYTNSAYIKADGFSWAILHHIDGSIGAWFNVSNGTVGTVNAGCTATIESVGNGWYRCSVAKISGGATGYTVVQLADADNSSTATTSGTNGLLIYGAQLNIGATAKPYFPTTDRLNVPRLTYQNGGGGCPSLLLEKQSTNIVTYSEDFTNAVWLNAGNITVTANSTTSPDGTQNADLFSHGSLGTYLYENLGTLSGTITTSIFVKKGSQSSIAFGFVAGGFTGGMSVKFNLDTQTFSGLTNYANFTSITATYESYGNGWYRLNLTGTTATSTVYYFVVGSLVDSFAVNAYLWGAQVEASSYATSYIGPTTSSSATRVADACFKTGISSLIGQTEGVLFTDFVCNGFEDYGTPLSVNNGSTTNYIWLTTFANGNIRAELYNGSAQGQVTYTGGVVGQRYKLAFAYKTNDFAMYINGSLVGTDVSGTTFSGTTLSRVDFNLTDNALYGNAVLKINQAALFPFRLTNAELASLTTI